MRSVVVAGHVCVDFIPQLPAAATTRPGELLEVGPLAVHAGGCVANTGGDLAELGADVDVVGDVGDDELGTLRRGAPAGARDAHRSDPAPERSLDVVLARVRAGRPGPLVLAPRRRQCLLRRVRRGPVRRGPPARGLPVAAARADRGRRRSARGAVRARAGGGGDHVARPGRDRPGVAGRAGGLAAPCCGACSRSWTSSARASTTCGPRSGSTCPTSATPRACCSTSDPRWCCSPRAPPGSSSRPPRRTTSSTPPAGEVRTTLGAGDAATAGLLYGLLEGLEPRATLELAARTAAARVSGAPLKTALPPRSPRR